MRTTYCLAALLALLVTSSQAQQTTGIYLDPRPYVADLNAVAALRPLSILTDQQVSAIAAVTCASMRTAVRDDLPRHLQAFVAQPLRDSPTEASRDEFLAFELDQLRKRGASEAAVALARTMLSEYGPPDRAAIRKLPITSEPLAALEARSCSGRATGAPSADVAAEPQRAALGRALAKAVVGTAVIVVDGALVVQTGGVIATVFSIASGGWGWNRVEEAYQELRK